MIIFGGTRILQNENKLVKYNTMLSYNTLDYEKVDRYLHRTELEDY